LCYLAAPARIEAEWCDNDLHMLREVVPDLAQRVVNGEIDIAQDRKEVTSANRPSGSCRVPDPRHRHVDKLDVKL
jgi:hypothetical protein